MKPSTFWQSLDSEERNALAKATGKSKQLLSNIFMGLQFSALPTAIDIARHCDNLIDPLDLISPENRKAVKVISGQKG